MSEPLSLTLSLMLQHGVYNSRSYLIHKAHEALPHSQGAARWSKRQPAHTMIISLQPKLA